jgi:hypothetical protein
MPISWHLLLLLLMLMMMMMMSWHQPPLLRELQLQLHPLQQ